jgi:hypothetical protein
MYVCLSVQNPKTLPSLPSLLGVLSLVTVFMKNFAGEIKKFSFWNVCLSVCSECLDFTWHAWATELSKGIYEEFS